MLNNVKKRRLMPLFFVYMKNRIKFVVNKIKNKNEYRK